MVAAERKRGNTRRLQSKPRPLILLHAPQVGKRCVSGVRTANGEQQQIPPLRTQVCATQREPSSVDGKFLEIKKIGDPDIQSSMTWQMSSDTPAVPHNRHNTVLHEELGEMASTLARLRYVRAAVHRHAVACAPGGCVANAGASDLQHRHCSTATARGAFGLCSAALGRSAMSAATVEWRAGRPRTTRRTRKMTEAAKKRKKREMEAAAMDSDEVGAMPGVDAPWAQEHSAGRKRRGRGGRSAGGPSEQVCGAQRLCWCAAAHAAADACCTPCRHPGSEG